jgi:hypothetical protein
MPVFLAAVLRGERIARGRLHSRDHVPGSITALAFDRDSTFDGGPVAYSRLLGRLAWKAETHAGSEIPPTSARIISRGRYKKYRTALRNTASPSPASRWGPVSTWVLRRIDKPPDGA